MPKAGHLRMYVSSIIVSISLSSFCVFIFFYSNTETQILMLLFPKKVFINEVDEMKLLGIQRGTAASKTV